MIKETPSFLYYLYFKSRACKSDARSAFVKASSMAVHSDTFLSDNSSNGNNDFACSRTMIHCRVPHSLALGGLYRIKHSL